MRGSGPALNWSKDLSMHSWGNISVGNDRVIYVGFATRGTKSTIPPELGNLTELVRLNLARNGLTGNIPAELGNLRKLEWLLLSYNQLSGSIPSELGNLSDLTILAMRSNQLSGSIPRELGNLTNLTELYLHWNRLGGSLPSQLGNLSKLEKLDLQQNQLSGNIPSELGNLSDLETFSLGFNQLSGSIPSQLGSLSQVGHFSINNNQLTGNIPPELGNLGRAGWISLRNNRLSGSIPSALGRLPSLNQLRLSCNQLSGQVPSAVGEIDTLANVWLHGNPMLDLENLPESLQRSGLFVGIEGDCSDAGRPTKFWTAEAIPAPITSTEPTTTVASTPSVAPTPTVATTPTGYPTIPDALPSGEQQHIVGETRTARAVAVSGDGLLIERFDSPGSSFLMHVGRVSDDESTIENIYDRDGVIRRGILRDETLGQTYVVLRLRDGRIVRRWISPGSPLVFQIDWTLVNSMFTHPVGTVTAISLDHQSAVAGQLVRQFEGDDHRILAFDEGLGLWRHVPDPATFQALGFYWCNVTSADTEFFDRIRIGEPFPPSSVPERGDYPNCG